MTTVDGGGGRKLCQAPKNSKMGKNDRIVCPVLYISEDVASERGSQALITGEKTRAWLPG